MVSDQIFKKALSRLATGVSIVSTTAKGERRGVTATAICSVSATPPTILVCVNATTGTCQMIRDAGHFAVNLLAEHHQPVAEIFAGRGGLQGNERFGHGDWVVGEGRGLPILSTAPAALECRVDKAIEAGTHIVFFGIIESAYFDENSPLIFHRGKFHVLPLAGAA